MSEGMGKRNSGGRPIFAPDPAYRLSPEIRSALASWVSVPAAEQFLAGVPKEYRADALELLKVSGEGLNQSVPQIHPTGDPTWDQAIWDLYEDVRKKVNVGDEFPFRRPVTDGKSQGA